MENYPKGYLEYIREQLGSEEYRNFFVDNIDVLQNGKRSCAWFVSSVAKHFDLIKEPRGDLWETVENLLEFGWQEVLLNNQKLEDSIKKAKKNSNIVWMKKIVLNELAAKLKSGDIIVWNKTDKKRYHIGFYVGSEKAISIHWKTGVPIEHDFRFRNFYPTKPEREIIMILRFSVEKRRKI